MKHKMKILILGIGQSNFLNPLYGEILKRYPTFEFFIDTYYDLDKEKNKSKPEIYSHFFNFKNSSISKWGFRKALMSLIFTKFFWEIIFFEWKQKKSFKEIKKIIFGFAKTKYYVENYINPLKMDIIHFHFCTIENLKEIHYLSRETKTICSFWGSDLMRFNEAQDIFYVRKALGKADSITLQSPEMAKMMEIKYGNSLRQKVTTLRFTLEIKIFKKIDELKSKDDWKILFKNRLNIPDDKIVVALGHNGFEANNHFLMIEQIEKMPRNLINKYVFVLHISYGGTEEYKKSLIRLSKDTDLPLLVVTEFFGPTDVAKFRLITNLLIQMPTTDALSSAMTEVLYAGNTVVAANWLPYDILGKNGVRLMILNGFNELPGFLEDFSENSVGYNAENRQNSKAIKEFLFPEKTTSDWVRLLKKTKELK